jgi:hypothetical protein
MKTLLALALFSLPLFGSPQLETSPAGVSEKKKGGHKDGGQKKDEEDEETFARYFLNKSALSTTS